ncbi:hypothetical protein Acr_20g0007680 [Actinidia rufa]|uniref:Uncharacterized protein n=1 Tax=Actinidia rufa TaxID=165716 RepID=A0A7J0GDQ4_9ERIC|nr:hypothetical protein Acr_20g0007680 [Actinidia rufa]
MGNYSSLPLDKEGVSHSKELLDVMGLSLVPSGRRGRDKEEGKRNNEKCFETRELGSRNRLVGVGKGVQHPFHFSGLFSSIYKFSYVISHGVEEHFLYATMKAIGMDMPPPVKVGACREHFVNSYLMQTREWFSLM